MMSISSGLRSLSIDEMLSILFLRTMPVANGLAIIPGDAYERMFFIKKKKFSLNSNGLNNKTQIYIEVTI